MLLAGIISQNTCFLERPNSSLGWEKSRAASDDLSVPWVDEQEAEKSWTFVFTEDCWDKKSTVSTAMQNTPSHPILGSHNDWAQHYSISPPCAGGCMWPGKPKPEQLDAVWQPLVYPEHLQYASRRALTTQELCTTLWAQIPLKQNPASSWFLLFYLLHRELSWKMSSNCKWLAGGPSVSITSTRCVLLPALQHPPAAPNTGEPSPSSHLRQWCQHSNIADGLVCMCTNKKKISVIFSLTMLAWPY